MKNLLKEKLTYGKPAGMYCKMKNIHLAVEKGFKYNTVNDADDLIRFGALEALKRARGT